MHKTITIVFALLYSLLLFGCNQQAINDTSTGEIILSERQHVYQNGTYTACGTHYDENGYLPAMQITVDKGIIINVDFDFFDQKGSRYSQQPDEKTVEVIQEFKTERKNLNSSLLEQQNTGKINNDDLVSDVYLIFANTLIAAAENGDTSLIGLSVKQTYTVSEPLMLIEQLNAVLSVTYQSDRISKIEFYIENEQKEDLSKLSQAAVFYESYGLDYENAVSLLTVLPEDSAQLLKQPHDSSFPELYQLYNRLAAKIDALRVPTTADPTQFFSSNK